MAMTSSLTELLGRDFAHEQRARGSAEALETALAEAVAAARAAWPTIRLSDADLLAHVGPRLRGDLEPIAALAALRVADLYLACACELGMGEALEAFEARYGADIQASLRRLRLDDGDVDETRQLLRTMLFLHGNDARPKIVEYSGRGDLRSWLRVVAVRVGLRASRQRKARPVGDDEAIGAMPAAGDDPEMEYLKRTHGAEFKEALGVSWKALDVRSRLLLRQYFGHGLTVDEIGAVHRVGRSTAARWVTAAREDLVSRTRDELMQRLALGRPEVASILRLIESQLASKVADLLGPSVDGPEGPRDPGDG